MNRTSASDVKKIMMSIFRRKGASGKYTTLFDDLTDENKKFILAKTLIYDEEEPIIVNIKENDIGFVLTNKRIVWYNGELSNTLSISSIRDATGDLKYLAQGPHAKRSMNRIKIITLNYDSQYIDVEPGPPFSGTLHVLKNLGSRNRAK